MLTADLIRASVRKRELFPRYIDATDASLIARADALVSLFRSHDSLSRGALDEALDDTVGDETHFAITRGLCKLLHDRSDWNTVAPLDPVDLRRRVFETAAACHPVGTVRSPLHAHSRDDVLERVAAELGVTAADVEEGLYADLRAEQRLTTFKPIDGQALLHRYNLALAQGLIMRAWQMRITVQVDRPSRLRALFRSLKFHQLMHRTTRVAGGYEITIDGPLSLFANSQRYGFQMALFLPALLLTDRWTLEADVDWPHAKGKLQFKLSADAGLVSHLRPKGTWITDEEKALTRRIDAHKSTWKVSRRATVVDLGGRDVLVPDFTVRCAETKREALVEVIGFWRRDYLERRLTALQKHGPSNLVLCVSRKMAAEKKVALDKLPGHVVDFAKVIPITKFLQAVEQVAK